MVGAMDKYKGRIIKKFRVLREQYQYLRGLADGLNEQTYQFLAHVAASTLLRLKEESEERYSPIYCKLIRREFGKAVNWRELQLRGIIDIKPYCKERGQSRKYKLSEAVIAELLAVAHNYSFDQHVNARLVNLMTGKLSSSRHKNVLYDQHGNEEPSLYVDAMREIAGNGSYFNFRAVAAVIQLRRAEMEDLEEAAEEILRSCGGDLQDRAYQVACKRYLKAQRQWQNDYYCFISVLHQNPVHVGGGIWRYEAAYKPASSGRAQQIGGGFQSASSTVKAAAVEGLENCHNYDLEASQLNVLRIQLCKAGISTAWLDKYLSTDQCKEVYAGRAGVSEKTWKTCLIALVMGAQLPSKPNRPTRMGNKRIILKTLWEEAEGDLAVLAIKLEGFTNEVQTLLGELDSWHDWLIAKFVPENAKFSKSGSYIENDMGKRLYLSEPSNGRYTSRKKKARIAAFLLQGTESAYIHRLTTLGPKYGFRIIANEHDGVISLGEIPREAQQETAELSGFTEAKLVIKPLLAKAA
jgi:hypothetical protein